MYIIEPLPEPFITFNKNGMVIIFSIPYNFLPCQYYVRHIQTYATAILSCFHLLPLSFQLFFWK